MKRILSLGYLILDAFDRRALARQPLEGEPDSHDNQIRNIAVATLTVRGAVWYLISRGVLIVAGFCALVSVVDLLNGMGLGFTHPSRAQPVQVEQRPTVTVGVSTAPAYHPRAKASENVQHPAAAGTAPTVSRPTTAAPQPSATATPGAPGITPLVDSLLKGTADTVADATSTLSQLLTAEAEGAVTTWCSLATALDSGPCDTAIRADWSSPENRSEIAIAAPKIVAVGQPPGNAAQYTYDVRFGASTVQITMVWDGHNWRLSEPDYQQALRDGGLLAPLGAITTIVLNLA